MRSRVDLVRVEADSKVVLMVGGQVPWSTMSGHRSPPMSAESLAEARLRVIDGEAVEEGSSEPRRAS
jgi:hypothetical protein